MEKQQQPKKQLALMTNIVRLVTYLSLFAVAINIYTHF